MASNRDYFVGFDLGATKMRAVVYDRKFQAHGDEKKKTRGREGMTATLARLEDVIRAALAAARIPAGRLAGIGVGCPGPLDLDRGVILEAPNLGWKNVKLRARLEKRYGCPVAILNDVDAGVYGEYRFGAGRGARCVIGIFPGTGIGGGCVYEGRILRGRTGSCLEVGHMQVQPDGPLCGCGRRGCLEALASRLAIAAAAAEAAYRGEAPHLLKLAGTDLAEIRSRTLAAAVKAGDRAIEDIVRQAARWIGVAAADLVHLLAPDIILLGGGLVEALPKLFQEEVEEGARNEVMPSFRRSFEVKIARLGDDATVLGAAAWAAATRPAR